jgi:hypothetical protein
MRNPIDLLVRSYAAVTGLVVDLSVLLYVLYLTQIGDAAGDLANLRKKYQK